MRDDGESAASVLVDDRKGWENGKGAKSHGGTVEVTEGDGCDASGPVMMVHKTKRLRVRCPVQKEAPSAVAACCVVGEEGS